MKMHHTLLLALVCSLPSVTWAQWQWLDKDGRKVFSDRAPPHDVPEKNILKQPGDHGKAARPATAKNPAEAEGSPANTPAAASPAAAASAPRAATKDKELEERKARAEATEAAKKKAEEDKYASARADNCIRARNAKVTFEAGRPIRQTNAQGESVFLDDAARASELRRIQDIIQSDCQR